MAKIANYINKIAIQRMKIMINIPEHPQNTKEEIELFASFSIPNQNKNRRLLYIFNVF